MVCSSSKTTNGLGPPVSETLLEENNFYQRGSWTPSYKYLQSVAKTVIDPPNGIVYTAQQGYYIKVGHEVTVFGTIQATIAPNTVNATRYFIAISGLPFKCGLPVAGDVSSSGIPSLCDIPNGYAGMIPTPVIPVFNGGYRTVLYEEGYPLDLVEYAFVNIDHGTMIMDGYTMALHGQITINDVSIEYPFIYEGVSGHGLLTSYWNDAGGALPSTIDFQCIYFTDD